MIPVARTQLADVPLSAWTDVDVSAYVDAGNTAGIILEIVNPTGTEYVWGIRKNGSSDPRKKGLEDTGHTWVAIGVDSNDIFEFYMANTAIDFYIVGYISSSEGAFFTNAVNKSLGSTGSWIDIDISGDTGGDTAVMAFWQIVNTSVGTTHNFGLRENGSTDDRKTGGLFQNDLRGAMMSVDVNEILEGWIASVQVDFFMTGYLTDNFTSFTNAKNYSTGTTGSYVDADFSSDIPVGNNGAFVHFSSGTEYAANIRKKGDAWDSYYDFSEHQYLWTEIDANRVAQQKIENTAMDLYLWGFTNAVADISLDMWHPKIEQPYPYKPGVVSY